MITHAQRHSMIALFDVIMKLDVSPLETKMRAAVLQWRYRQMPLRGHAHERRA